MRAQIDARLSAPLPGQARREVTDRAVEDEMALFFDASKGV